jgi:hypothetical protein
MYEKNKHKISVIFCGLLFSQIHVALAEGGFFSEFRKKTDALIKLFSNIMPENNLMKHENNSNVKKDFSTQVYSESLREFKKTQQNEAKIFAQQERDVAIDKFLVKIVTDGVVPVSQHGYEKAKEFGSYISKEMSEKIATKKEQYKKESDSVIRQKDENFDQPPQNMLALKDAVLKKYAKTKELFSDVSKKFGGEEKDLIQTSEKVEIQKDVLDDNQALFNHIQNTFNEENPKIKQAIDEAFAEGSEKIKQNIINHNNNSQKIEKAPSVLQSIIKNSILLKTIKRMFTLQSVAEGVVAGIICGGLLIIADKIYEKYVKNKNNKQSNENDNTILAKSMVDTIEFNVK